MLLAAQSAAARAMAAQTRLSSDAAAKIAAATAKFLRPTPGIIPPAAAGVGAAAGVAGAGGVGGAAAAGAGGPRGAGGTTQGRKVGGAAAAGRAGAARSSGAPTAAPRADG